MTKKFNLSLKKRQTKTSKQGKKQNHSNFPSVERRWMELKKIYRKK